MQVASFKRVKTNAQLWTTQLFKLTTPDGTKITRMTEHGYRQAAKRSVSLTGISEALTQPLHIGNTVIDDKGRSSKHYIGNAATAVLNPNSGEIATAWPTSKRLRKKYGGTV